MFSKLNQKIATSKVVVLGFDGLDPQVLETGWEKGMFKNFASLREKGSYKKLDTTIPPQSPVAWASFITGASPAKHGLYDFIVRDPSNYELSLVFSKGKEAINIPKFWDILVKHKIHTTTLFLPDTYPPTPLAGNMISGMGVPDITGTEGSFTFFSTKDYVIDSKWRGNVVKLDNKEEVNSLIPGPKYSFLNQTKTAEIPFKVRKILSDKSVEISVDHKTIVLKEDEFSDWVDLEFSIDYFTKIRGIAQFYVKQIDPNLEIYLSPINFNPKKPIFPISYPKNFSGRVAKEKGYYSTLGLPHDTWALEENILNEDSFLKQVDLILAEREGIYFNELNRFKSGVFIGYFGMTDTVQHMFWRFLNDPQSKYQNTILDYYQKMDDILGKTLKILNKDKDVVIVLSDHGFSSFDYEFNLNSWLKSEGYLTLKENKEVGRELLEDVDWSKTKAYAIGYNGIYLNLQSREKLGLVSQVDAKSVENEIRGKLVTLTNPFTDSKIIKQVYDREELGIDFGDNNSPDLFVGYYKGIRSSWDTAVGAAPKEIFKRRESKWSGDHLFDYTEIPGVLLTNEILKSSNPKIIDVIPSVFNLLGIPTGPSMEGKNIF